MCNCNLTHDAHQHQLKNEKEELEDKYRAMQVRAHQEALEYSTKLDDMVDRFMNKTLYYLRGSTMPPSGIYSFIYFISSSKYE